MGHGREDYSENGDAWSFFTHDHDHARSRAYRWGEDGLATSADAVVPQRLVGLDCRSNRAARKPHLHQTDAPAGVSAVSVAHQVLGEFVLSCEGNVPLLFTENETNHERLFPGFYEYFHGDNGAGLGASHQTGWTGVVASLIELYGVVEPERALELGKKAAFEKGSMNAFQKGLG